MNKVRATRHRYLSRSVFCMVIATDSMLVAPAQAVAAQLLVDGASPVAESDSAYTSLTGPGRRSSAIYVTGPGQLTGTNLTATTNTSSASAIAADTGGIAALSGGLLRSTFAGPFSYTVLARASGSSITLNNVEVTSTTSSAVVSAETAHIALNGGSVALSRTAGTEPAMAVLAQTNATVTTQDTNITVTGDVLRGASSLSSTVNMTGGTVMVNGANSFGLYADRLSSGGPTGDVLTADNVKISTVGAGSTAVQVLTGAGVTLSNMDIATNGADAIGIHAGRGAAVNVSGTLKISTQGDRAYGADAGGPLNGKASNLTLGITGTIDTAGTQAHGLLAREGGVVSLNGGSVTARGTDAAAIAARASTINVTGASLASNAGAGALVVGNSAVGLVNTALTAAQHGVSIAAQSGLISALPPEIPDGAPSAVSTEQPAATASNTVTMHGGSIRSGGDLFHVEGTSASITLSGGVQGSAGSGLLLNALTSGTSGSRVSFVMDGTSLTGDIAADAASVVTANLRNSAVLTGKIDPVSLAIDGTSRWNVTADSQLNNLSIASGGLAQFQPPTVGGFKTLTIQGALSGNGTIGLNTVLAGDGAASDRIVINGGTATGTTALRIANAGGAGALTAANGIQVVEATNGGTTAATAFALDGRAVAGAYEYRLFRGSADGSMPDAWYLRSEQESPNPPAPPAPPGPPAPLYRPEVSAYLANQHLAGQMFVHSLHDRLGEPQYVQGQGFNPEQDKPRAGWLRVVGNWQGSKSADGIFKASTNSFLMHGGAELAKWRVFSGGADRAHVGLMGSYGYANTNATAQGNPFSAKGTVEAWGVGGYGTWYQNDEQKLGAYVDTWFQYGWFTNHVDGQHLPSVRYNAQGWAVSGETGYAMPLRNDWVIEPQGQVVYVGYSESDITEPGGTRVTGANSHGWITRLGARLHRTFPIADDRKLQPYLTLNWWHTSVTSSISFNDLPLGSMYPSNRYEIKLGLNADLGKRWTGWTNVSGAWGAQSFYQYAARVGVKYSW